MLASAHTKAKQQGLALALWLAGIAHVSKIDAQLATTTQHNLGQMSNSSNLHAFPSLLCVICAQGKPPKEKKLSKKKQRQSTV